MILSLHYMARAELINRLLVIEFDIKQVTISRTVETLSYPILPLNTKMFAFK